MLQPILVIALQKVNLTVLMYKESNRAIDLVIVFKIIYAVILGKRISEFFPEFKVRAIAYAENVEAVVCKLATKFPVINGEIWRNKDKVFHVNSFYNSGKTDSKRYGRLFSQDASECVPSGTMREVIITPFFISAEQVSANMVFIFA